MSIAYYRLPITPDNQLQQLPDTFSTDHGIAMVRLHEVVTHDNTYSFSFTISLTKLIPHADSNGIIGTITASISAAMDLPEDAIMLADNAPITIDVDAHDTPNKILELFEPVYKDLFEEFLNRATLTYDYTTRTFTPQSLN